MAVAISNLKMMGADAIRALGKADHVLYDLKYVLSQAESDLTFVRGTYHYESISTGM